MSHTERKAGALVALDKFMNIVLPAKLWDGNNRYCSRPGYEGSEYADDLKALCEARAVVAELIEEIERLRVKANLWDDLGRAREQTQVEPEDTEWKRLVRSGDLIGAIKACRTAHGYSLRESKNCVDGYRADLVRVIAQ